MSITRNNYEAYFLDYYENNLAPEQVAELMLFLESNPDLRDEFEENSDPVYLENKYISGYSGKEALKKKEYRPSGDVNALNYEDKFIALLEGDLADNETEEVYDFIKKNPETATVLELFRKTYLHPEKITYPEKETLKKKTPIVAKLRFALSIAAAIIILMGIYFILSLQGSDKREPEIAVSVPEPVSLMKVEVRNEIRPINLQDLKAGVADASMLRSYPKRDTALITASLSRITPLVAKQLKLNNPDFYAPVNITPKPVDIVFPDSPGVIKRKPFISRFIAAVVKKAIPVKKPEKRSLIEYTVSGYNLIADKDVQVEKEYDENGRVTGYNVIGDNVTILARLREKSSE